MGLFDLFNNRGGVFPRPPKYRGESDRLIERKIKEISPDAGAVVEKINNTLDSIDNLNDATEIKVDPISDLFKDSSEEKFYKGDHIAVKRIAYSHHGIYDGDKGVYEYNDSIVRRVSLSDFADGGKVYKVKEKTIYSAEMIIGRASSRLGEQKYNVIYNNCQNFATWCRLGD